MEGYLRGIIAMTDHEFQAIAEQIDEVEGALQEWDIRGDGATAQLPWLHEIIVQVSASRQIHQPTHFRLSGSCLKKWSHRGGATLVGSPERGVGGVVKILGDGTPKIFRNRSQFFLLISCIRQHQTNLSFLTG